MFIIIIIIYIYQNILLCVMFVKIDIYHIIVYYQCGFICIYNLVNYHHHQLV